MIRSFLARLFPVREEPFELRRRKYLDGLGFRAIAALAFLALFFLLDDEVGPIEFSGVFSRTTPALLTLLFVNAAYWIVGIVTKFSIRLFYLHWAIDLILISIILNKMGGIDTPYGFLAYLMIVVTSASFTSLGGAMVVATGAMLSTCLLVSLEWLHVVPHYDIWSYHYGASSQVAIVSVATVFYYMFAYLSGTLSDQLKELNSKLELAGEAIELQNRTLEETVALRTEALETRNSEIEEFVHIITHDLKNLSVGAAETMRKLLKAESESLSEKGNRYAGYVLEDTRLMNDMLVRLLELFRASEEDAEILPVDLDVVVREVARLQQGAMEQGGVKLTIKPLPKILADERSLRHVVANLLDNAVKYVGENRKGRIIVSAESDDAMVTVTVSDNGIGIRESQLERIFQLYHRAPDQEVDGKTQTGSGVGLAICKRMVERWGGSMWVTSSAGIGSVFYFTAPCVAQETESTAQNL